MNKPTKADLYYYGVIGFLIGSMFTFNFLVAWSDQRGRESTHRWVETLDLRQEALDFRKQAMDLHENVVFQAGRVQELACDHDPAACGIKTYEEFIKYLEAENLKEKK